MGCSKQTITAGKPLTYIYIYDDINDKPTDSLEAYANGSWEESLELYKDIDSLSKTITMTVYIGIFKLNKQRFAVITDTSGTAFYKYNGNHYKPIFKDVPKMAFTTPIIKHADYNNDGYTDVFYSVPSGGSYGSDDYLLFFDPNRKTLTHHDEPELRNTEIKGSIVRCGSNMWAKEYVIEEGKLRLQSEEEIIQSDSVRILKRAITYDKEGNIIKNDTLTLNL